MAKAPNIFDIFMAGLQSLGKGALGGLQGIQNQLPGSQQGVGRVEPTPPFTTGPGGYPMPNTPAPQPGTQMPGQPGQPQPGFLEQWGQNFGNLAKNAIQPQNLLGMYAAHRGNRPLEAYATGQQISQNRQSLEQNARKLEIDAKEAEQRGRYYDTMARSSELRALADLVGEGLSVDIALDQLEIFDPEKRARYRREFKEYQKMRKSAKAEEYLVMPVGQPDALPVPYDPVANPDHDDPSKFHKLRSNTAIAVSESAERRNVRAEARQEKEEEKTYTRRRDAEQRVIDLISANPQAQIPKDLEEKVGTDFINSYRNTVAMAKQLARTEKEPTEADIWQEAISLVPGYDPNDREKVAMAERIAQDYREKGTTRGRANREVRSQFEARLESLKPSYDSATPEEQRLILEDVNNEAIGLIRDGIITRSQLDTMIGDLQKKQGGGFFAALGGLFSRFPGLGEAADQQDAEQIRKQIRRRQALGLDASDLISQLPPGGDLAGSISQPAAQEPAGAAGIPLSASASALMPNGAAGAAGFPQGVPGASQLLAAQMAAGQLPQQPNIRPGGNGMLRPGAPGPPAAPSGAPAQLPLGGRGGAGLPLPQAGMGTPPQMPPGMGVPIQLPLSRQGAAMGLPQVQNPMAGMAASHAQTPMTPLGMATSQRRQRQLPLVPPRAPQMDRLGTPQTMRDRGIILTPSPSLQEEKNPADIPTFDPAAHGAYIMRLSRSENPEAHQQGGVLMPYRDGNGWSIGYGHRILPGEEELQQGITLQEAQDLRDRDVAVHGTEAASYYEKIRKNTTKQRPPAGNKFHWDTLPAARQEALTDLVYQRGMTNAKAKMKKFWKAVSRHDWEAAAVLLENDPTMKQFPRTGLNAYALRYGRRPTMPDVSEQLRSLTPQQLHQVITNEDIPAEDRTKALGILYEYMDSGMMR